MAETHKIHYEIKPPRGLIQIDWSELWQFRELFYIFVWREVKVRYKQTVIGISWAILQPLLTMIIFTFFFGRLIKVPSDNVPYPIFVFTGLVYWNYFSLALSNISGSLLEHEGIIKKIYFPRLILPAATAITPVIDFLIALIILIILMFIYHYLPGAIGLLLVPLLIIISVISVIGLGFFLSSVNVKYRDVRYALPFFIQILMYITPVIYPVSIIPSRFQWIIYLNPMAGVITTARSSLLGSVPVNWALLLIALAESLILLFAGIYYFRKTERFFADIL